MEQFVIKDEYVKNINEIRIFTCIQIYVNSQIIYTRCFTLLIVEYNACRFNPCKNNAICNKDGKVYTCICSGNYEGKTCEGESLDKYKRQYVLLVRNM